MHRATERMQGIVSGGVGKLGDGVSALGGGLAHLGDQVDRLPGVGKALGAGVRDLGGGISDLGEGLTALPVMRKTADGRAMVRSLFVGMIVVTAWILGIVALQRRGEEPPDLRPTADAILRMLQANHPEQVYSDASPRFQELMAEDVFVDRMHDLSTTMGDFLEMEAVNGTLVTHGPGGLIARVDLTLRYANGKTKGSMSFQSNHGIWKLLGLSVDVPQSVQQSAAFEQQRKDRVADKEELKKVRAAAEAVLALMAAGKYDVVWDGAAPVFQASVAKRDFADLELDREKTLGEFHRLLDVTDGKTYLDKLSASLDTLVEYDNAVVSTRFEFVKIIGVWKMKSYKVVLPLPRVADSP